MVRVIMATSLTPTADLILSVDDDRDDADLLRLLLRKAKVEFPVQAFFRPDEFLASLATLIADSVRAVRPLLCFLDVKMPVMTGYDLLRWVRQQPALDPMPVVMLSSSELPGDVQRAAREGAQCYLTKYPQPAILRAVVDDAHKFALGSPAAECFRLPENQLLVRGRRV
jgi:CheY-like chemotaxis protein